jgi:predicted RNase H-like HicB family nuclease
VQFPAAHAVTGEDAAVTREFYDWDEVRAELHDGDDAALAAERVRTGAWVNAYHRTTSTRATFTAAVHQEEGWYVARCRELDVASQGETLDDALANLREAVDLYLEELVEPTRATSLVSALRKGRGAVNAAPGLTVPVDMERRAQLLDAFGDLIGRLDIELIERDETDDHADR